MALAMPGAISLVTGGGGFIGGHLVAEPVCGGAKR